MDDAVHEQHQSHEGHHQTGDVELLWMRVLGFRHHPHNPHEADSDDRNIHEEYGSPIITREPTRPTGVLQQDAAQHRTQGNSTSHRSGPQTDRFAALMWWENHCDDRQCHG